MFEKTILARRARFRVSGKGFCEVKKHTIAVGFSSGFSQNRVERTSRLITARIKVTREDILVCGCIVLALKFEALSVAEVEARGVGVS